MPQLHCRKLLTTSISQVLVEAPTALPPLEQTTLHHFGSTKPLVMLLPVETMLVGQPLPTPMAMEPTVGMLKKDLGFW